ncbi:hypothetical protein ACROYT_G043751 [Oculina patagonica]
MNHQRVLLLLFLAVFLVDNVCFGAVVNDLRQHTYRQRTGRKRSYQSSLCAQRKRTICEAMTEYCFSDEFEREEYSRNRNEKR